MEKIKYDFAFPLGAACASSLALRAAKLQFASFPFDWTAGGDVVGRAQIVADDFSRWLQIEDLELTDVLHATFNASIYRNRRTGLSFTHDFPAGCYLKDELPGVAEKYERRIKRLYAEIGKAKRVLVVYNEIPYRPVASEDEIIKAQRILQNRFPQVRIDLVYFAQDPACKDREPRILNDNVTMALEDYHSVLYGYVAMPALYHKMAKYLREHVEVPDVRMREEVESAAAAALARERFRWGVGLQRWVNVRAYHLYRHLERFLAKRGCVPAMERPLKLYDERGERRRSLADPDVSFLPRDEEAVKRAYGLL